MSIIVYHGGTDKIEHPLFDAGRANLDFGLGFYVTDMPSQATEWAKKVADHRRARPIVNQYTLNREAILSEYRCKVFTDYDGEWLDFIVASRQGQKPWMQYDYIEGGVADDRVIDTINLLKFRKLNLMGYKVLRLLGYKDEITFVLPEVTIP